MTYFYGSCLSFLLLPSSPFIFFLSILHSTHGPVYIEYPLAHTFRKVVLIRHKPTTSLLCSIGSQTFFYRCTEMFPDKPNLRSRKAFFVVKKRLIWSALA